MLFLGEGYYLISVFLLFSYALYLLSSSSDGNYVSVTSVFLGGIGLTYLFQWDKDPYFMGLKLLSLLTVFLIFQFLREFEFILVVLLTLYGLFLLVEADSFLSFYLSLELSSLGSYLLAGYDKNRRESTEAGLKYFVLGSLASGILVFGLVLIYGLTGLNSFHQLSELGLVSKGVLSGVSLVLIGLFFKLGAAPFHSWLPDVYEGALVPVVTFFAVIPKWAFLSVLMKWCDLFGAGLKELVILSIMGSFLIGTLGGLYQQRMKRWLGYSSITDVGFLLVGVLCDSIAMEIYLFVYLFTNLLVWSFLLMSDKKNPLLLDFSGLGSSHWGLAGILTLALFSAAGVPPLLGFLGKLVIFRGGLLMEQYGLVFLAILSSVLAAIYYLRLIVIFYFRKGESQIKDVGVVVSYVMGIGTIGLVFGGFSFF